MAEGFGQLRKAVLKEVQRQRQAPPHSAPSTSARALGLFLDECLKKRNITRADYAAALNMEPELLTAILDGLLPASELHIPLLVELAAPLNLQPAILLTLMRQGGEDDHDRPAHA
jgi:hypothetical protein